MDSNNGLDNMQPTGPTEPLDLTHSMEPLQPTQPMEQAQIQPVQMAQPLAQPMETKPNKKPNFLLIGIIVGVLVIVAIVLVIVALNFAGGQKSKPAEPVVGPEPEEDVGLTVDLARSVCKKNNGIFEAVEDKEQNFSQSGVKSVYTCKYYKNAQETDSGYCEEDLHPEGIQDRIHEGYRRGV